MSTQNYVLGKGELYFAPFLAGGQIPGGERYLGNTPLLALTMASTNLDHFSSDHGIKEKDDSVTIEVTRTGNFTCDNIDKKNLAIFLFGSASVLAQGAATTTDFPIADVEVDSFYQLGVSDANPTGVRALDVHTAATTGGTPTPAKKVIVKKASVELVEGTDYAIDMVLARLHILPGGTLVDGDDITVSFKTLVSTRDFIQSGSTPIEGALRLISRNPKGTQMDYFIPWVKLTPNGNFDLKADTWLTIPFNIEALLKPGLAAIYLDGRAVTA